ncbi:MAG: T9SS type A sorting domain-containing protein [Bacteroidota bacterium]
MKYIYLLIGGLMLSFSMSFAQQVEQVSMGPSYAQTAFYTFSTDSAINYDHTMWDLSFVVTSRGSSVFYNEAVSRGGNHLELFLASGSDFASIDTAGMTLIYNPEISWSDGAFNAVKDDSDPFDIGWGTYSPTSNTVSSSRFFVLKMRDATYKKIEIQSLASGIYSFRHADLDGGNEVSQTVDKANYTGKSRAYYSIVNDTLMDLEPPVWDLMFTRYWTPLDDGTGTGNLLDYMVTGILTNAGVEVAQADGIDPMTVNYMDYDTSYSTVLTTIGHDWKEFDLGTFAWSIPSDRVYFVKNAQLELWKVQFIDFEGSSTGVSTFEQTFLTNVTSIGDEFENLESYEIFPNPVNGDNFNLAFEISQPSPQGQLIMRNQLGQLIFTQNISIQQGLNVREISSRDLSSGVYFISLQVGNDLITKKLLVN